jgi:hypothetical protein
VKDGLKLLAFSEHTLFFFCMNPWLAQENSFSEKEKLKKLDKQIISNDQILKFHANKQLGTPLLSNYPIKKTRRHSIKLSFPT